MKDLIQLLPRIDAAIQREVRSATARGRRHRGLRREFTEEQQALLRDTSVSSRRLATLLSTGYKQVDKWRSLHGVPNARKKG